MSPTIVFGGLILIALTCFQQASADVPSLWPEIMCHKYYDHSKQKTFAVANSGCRDGTKLRKNLAQNYGINDLKGCILWRLQAIIVENDKTFQYTENQGLRKTLQTIFNGLYSSKLGKEENGRRKQFIEGLLERSADCKPLLNEYANDKKRPSKEWTEFYDCINEAWKCGAGHTAPPPSVSHENNK